MRLPEVLARLLPRGRAVGAEWHAGSLHGEAGDSLRVRLRGERAGVWCDFATGDKGGDPISLAAAVAGLPQQEAARQLARMLRMEGSCDVR
jgi:twinkle protein